MSKPGEGVWFGVPVAPDLVAVGLVARSAKRGEVAFGYFFAPRGAGVPSLADLRDLSPADAIVLTRFLHTALVSGHWPILGSVERWNRSDWPMPEFHEPWTLEMSGESWANRYSEDEPDRILTERRIEPEDERLYPPDFRHPPGNLEYRLQGLLGLPQDKEADESSENEHIEGVRHFLFVPSAAVAGVRQQLDALGFANPEIGEERDGLVDIAVFQPGSVGDLQSSATLAEAKLSELASSVGGDYDGLEWALSTD
jgi:hypothetical protein